MVSSIVISLNVVLLRDSLHQINGIVPDSTQEEEIIRALSKATGSDCLDMITYIQSEWPEDISPLS